MLCCEAVSRCSCSGKEAPYNASAVKYRGSCAVVKRTNRMSVSSCMPIGKGNKKPPPLQWHASHCKDGGRTCRVTTLLYAPLAGVRLSGYGSIPSIPDNGGILPPQPCPQTGSVRSSKTIFRRALRVPLSPSGTRFGVPHRVLFSSSHFIALYDSILLYCGRFVKCLRQILPENGVRGIPTEFIRIVVAIASARGYNI